MVAKPRLSVKARAAYCALGATATNKVRPGAPGRTATKLADCSRLIDKPEVWTHPLLFLSHTAVAWGRTEAIPLWSRSALLDRFRYWPEAAVQRLERLSEAHQTMRNDAW